MWTLWLALACSSPAHTEPAAHPEPAADRKPEVPVSHADPGHLAVAHDHVAAADAQDLPAVMHELEVAMADLSGSLWRSDHPGVAREAQRIADHPHIAPSEIARIHAVLGDRMTAFHRADEDVHDSAVRLAEAAGSNDVPAILQHLAELQAGCVACHRGFREDLRQP